MGQFDETRARVFLAEGRNIEAEKAARVAVALLEKGDMSSWLAGALTTHGIALARLNHPDQSREALDRAISVAEQVGDFEKSGVAALTMIEQLGKALSTSDVCELLQHAGSLLQKTQDIDTLRRLAEAAFQGLFLVHASRIPPDFSLRRDVHRYEEALIKKALSETGGAVTKAAHLLGFEHHQSLISLIAARHPDLTDTRKPVRPRRKHLFSEPRKQKK